MTNPIIEELLYYTFGKWHPHNSKAFVCLSIATGKAIAECDDQKEFTIIFSEKMATVWFTKDYQKLTQENERKQARDTYYVALERRELLILNILSRLIGLPAEDCAKMQIHKDLRMKSKNEIVSILSAMGVGSDKLVNIEEVIKPENNKLEGI